MNVQAKNIFHLDNRVAIMVREALGVLEDLVDLEALGDLVC